MSEATESISIQASLAETWDTYFDPKTWPAWADQFQSVVSGEGYPDKGSTLRWRSTRAGRGEVLETVAEHEPRRIHRVTFTDPQTEGELTTTFEIEGEGTKVTQALAYSLRSGGPFMWATDKLFIRSQQRRSMQRSLGALKREAEEAARFAERAG